MSFVSNQNTKKIVADYLIPSGVGAHNHHCYSRDIVASGVENIAGGVRQPGTLVGKIVLGGPDMAFETGFDVAGNNDSESLVFDLTDVQENAGNNEVLPKGEYVCIVDEMTFGESSKGNPMITVVYQVVEGEFEKHKLWDYWVIRGNGSEFGLAKLKKFLTRVCPEVPLGAFNPAVFCDEGTAVGREVLVTVKVQTQKKGEYKGEKRNQVADVQAGGGTGSFL